MDRRPQFPIPRLKEAGGRLRVVRTARPVNIAELLVGGKRRLLGGEVAVLLVALGAILLCHVGIGDVVSVVGVIGSGTTVVNMFMAMLMEMARLRQAGALELLVGRSHSIRPLSLGRLLR